MSLNIFDRETKTCKEVANKSRAIVLDSTMSDTSENGVQNKVIKAYVDEHTPTITINEATTTSNGLMSASDKTKLNGIASKAEVNVQSDWSVTDTSSDAYIKNKPTIDSAISTTSTNAVQNKAVTAELNKKVNTVSGKGLSTNDYTTTEKTKLSKIADGAEVNVQSDWSVTDTSSDAYIKNKPSLSTVATSGSYNDLSNKPTIPSAVTVDSAISSTSTNAVQNKVVKSYVDDKFDYSNDEHTIDIIGTDGYNIYMRDNIVTSEAGIYRHSKVGVQDSMPFMWCKYYQTNESAGTTSWTQTELDVPQYGVDLCITSYDASNDSRTNCVFAFNHGKFYSYGNQSVISSLGTAGNAWANIYSNTAVTVTSDRNKKKDIQDISTDRAIELIKHLKPSTYKLIDGTSDRTHYGMIAQDVEEMLTELGMDSKDFAGFIKSPKEEIDKETGKSTVVEGEYDYMLRYEEFIAPLISTVQNLMDRVEVLEAKLKELEG